MASKKRASRKSNRTPVGGNREKLAVPESLKNPSFEYRWVNDVPGNLRRYKDAGYEVVEDPDMVVGEDSVDHSRYGVSAVVKSVGSTRESKDTTAVLMRIHKDYYKEDQQAKMDELDEVEQSMYQRNAGQEGFYEKEHERSRT